MKSEGGTRSKDRSPRAGRRAADRPVVLRGAGTPVWPAWWDWRLASLLASAFAIKATVLAQLGGHPLLQPHGELDTALYVELAQKVALGGPLAVTEPFFVSPLYVYFLATVFRLGGSIVAVQLIQILLGTAAVGLLFLTARHWFGERAAWLAGLLAALTGLFTFYEILLLQAALDPFLVAWALYLISRAQTDDRGWPLAAAGAAAGLLALNRPNALAYGVSVAAWLAFQVWRDRAASVPRVARRARLGRTLIFPACLLLVLALNGLRNYAVSGDWILISSHGGLNFYIGNSAEADGIYHRIAGISPSIAGQARDAARLAETAGGRRLSTGEVSSYFYGRAWDWITGHTVEAARLFLWKVVLLLNRTNVPLNHSYAYYSQEETTLLRRLFVGPWLLVPLGLVGLFLSSARRARRGYWVWASFVPVYGLSVAAFFVSSRYRMPLLVPLCATAAATLAWGYEHLRALRSVALVAAALAVVATLVNWPLGIDDGRGFEQTRLAVWLVEQGRYDEAREYVARVAPSHTHPGVLRYRVGRALSAAGRFDEAVGHFGEALAIDRGQAAIELELGQALAVTRRAREAVPHLEAALEAGHRPEVSAPWLARALVACGETERVVDLLAKLPDGLAASGPQAALDLGTIALEVSALAQAQRWLRLAVKAEAAPAQAHEKLGVTLLLLNHLPEAVTSLEAACRLDPSSASARLNLGVTYAKLGRLDDARAEIEEALRLNPNESRAAQLLKVLGSRTGRTKSIQ